MCPDRQILSVYLDGGIPSPWKEKMESHLERCPQCRQRLESYRLISASVAADTGTMETARMEAAKERVWRNLEARERHGGRSGVLIRKASVWKRSVSIPLPAVAAAAVVLVIAMGVLWIRRPVEQPAVIPQMLLASEESLEAPGAVPIADMNGVLQYLGSRDNGEILILRLPESRNFMSSGEPTILKAADYTRR
jgi:anti-sigma factor RsiW